MATWSGRAAVKGGSETVRMALLTFVSVGVTFTWGVEMTYCTPYLLTLGLTKGQTSLVWIAGPLSGLVVQPIVGVISDGFKSRWGRRRPFIVACSVIVALGVLTLGFTREIVGLFVADDTDEVATAGASMSPIQVFTIALAVLALYTTDFAINAVMSCGRSLIVDTLPIQKQQSGAAWYSRMSSIGHIIGYGAGAVDLVARFGTTLGDTQFKQLTVIAATGILVTAFVTCWAVSERVLLASSAGPGHHRTSMHRSDRFKVVRQIYSTLLNLPPRMQAICWAVFWSWIGWFPFMIYSSTWVGETYFRYDVPEAARASDDALGDMGRVGSYSLTVYSIVSFLSAWILPLFVRSPDDEEAGPAATVSSSISPPNGAPTEATSRDGLNPLEYLQRLRSHPEVVRLLARFNYAKPDLLTVWFVGHLIFAASMSMAPWAASFRFATALVAICGIPWSIANWAPIAFIGVEVNRLTGPTPAAYRRLSTASMEMELLPSVSSVPPGGDFDEDNTDDVDLEEQQQSAAAPATSGSSGGELSGVYFGILNMYITIPQFVGTLISAVVFALLEPGKSPELATDAHPSEHHSTDGPNAIAVCLFIGAISAAASAYATSRLRQM